MKEQKTIKENLFGGKDAEQMNVLLQAFKDCARDDGSDLYNWLDDIPKTSMVVYLVEKLNQLGYKITKL